MNHVNVSTTITVSVTLTGESALNKLGSFIAYQESDFAISITDPERRTVVKLPSDIQFTSFIAPSRTGNADDGYVYIDGSFTFTFITGVDEGLYRVNLLYYNGTGTQIIDSLFFRASTIATSFSHTIHNISIS